MTVSTIARVTRDLLAARELPLGTSLENRVTWLLHKWKILDQTQYRVGKYRLDYAWPKVKMAIEADGPFHRQPQAATSDAIRDAYLRSQGWMVFRVDAESHSPPGTLDEQLCRAVRCIRSELFEVAS